MAVRILKKRAAAAKGKVVEPAAEAEEKYVYRPPMPEENAVAGEGAHKRLLSLGQERVDTIVSRMVSGDSFTTLARVIQSEWKELMDVKEITLIKELSRFRKDRVDGKLLYLAKTDYGQMVAERFGKNVDVLDGLIYLVQIQQERCSKMLEREQVLPTLLPAVKLELQTLANLYAQLGQLQMDLGVIRRVPKELMVASVEVAASRAQEVIEKAMESDKNVTNALAKAFTIIEGKFTRVPNNASISDRTVR